MKSRIYHGLSILCGIVFLIFAASGPDSNLGAVIGGIAGSVLFFILFNHLADKSDKEEEVSHEMRNPDQD